MKRFLFGVLMSAMVLEVALMPETIAVEERFIHATSEAKYEEDIAVVSEKFRNIDLSKCGENMRWTYKNGTLTITGSGDMYDYTLMTVPFWHVDHSREIDTIVFEGNITRIGSCAFAGFTNLTSIVIPESVTSIGDSVFFECNNLTTITIPNSVTVIEDGVFMDCHKFSDVYFSGSEAEWHSISKGKYNEFLLSANVHYNAINNTTQENSANDGWITADWAIGGRIKFDDTTGTIVDADKSIKSVNIPDKINGKEVLEVGNEAFFECMELEYVVLPQTTISIGNWAFESCSQLTSISMPNVTNIGSSAFFSCNKLSSIILSEGLTKIEEHVFSYNMSLETITIPISLNTVECWAFFMSSNLSDVYYSGTKVEWDAISINYEFSGNNSLAEATIHYNATQQPTSPTYSSWATSHIEKAQTNDLIVDSLGKDYTSNITRSQIADLLVNMVEKYTETTLTSADSSTFTDTSDTAILKANQAGIISGMGDGTFAPNSTATREQIAMMIYKTILVMEEETGSEIVTKNTTLGQYNDSSDVSDWAVEAVAVLANNGIMEGTGDGNLSPLATASIEQGIILNNALFELNK